MFFRLDRRAARPHRRGAATRIHLSGERAAHWPATLSHGQKQWLEIGMLLMQDPKLLLLDEPVAGMTDEETERTAELFLSLEGPAFADGGGARHELRRAAISGEEGDRAARGLGAGRGHAGRGAGDDRWSRCIWAVDPGTPAVDRRLQPRAPCDLERSASTIDHAASVEEHQPVLRRLAHPAQRELRGAALGEVTVMLGRNGVGKTTLLKSLMGLVPIKTGSIELDGAPIHAGHALRARARRHRLRAAGPRDLRAAHGRGEPAHGPGVRSRRHADPGRAVRAVPGAQADAQPPRRRPVGRPAAAARDRARAGRQARSC